MCGFKCSRSIVRAAAQGRLRLYKRDDWWHVSRAAVRRAPLLTAGRLAAMAKCSTKTVWRRVASGALEPWRDPRRARGYEPANRFRLADVALLRASLRKVVFGRRVN